jgi:hypothetical protein
VLGPGWSTQSGAFCLSIVPPRRHTEMAAQAAEQHGAESDKPFTWVRCAGCKSGLWRRYADHLEMRVSPRGGQVRTIRVLIQRVDGPQLAFSVTCEKCDTVWTGTTDVPMSIEGSK